MGMRMVREPVRGIGAVPIYQPEARWNKPQKAVLAIPHTNEMPAVLPFRKALADRLMAEGIQVATREDTSMMERGLEARLRIDAHIMERLRKELGERIQIPGKERIALETMGWSERYKLMSETLRMLASFEPMATTVMLSMDDEARRVRAIAECMDAGNGLVVELHAMNPNAYFGAADVEAGFRRLADTTLLFAPDATININRSFLAYRTTLAEDRNITQAVSELAGVIGLDMENVFVEYFRARDRVHMLGGTTALIEIPSATAELPAGHPIPYYGDLSRSEFETAYCAVTREPVGFSSGEVEAAAWALGAIEKRA